MAEKSEQCPCLCVPQAQGLQIHPEALFYCTHERLCWLPIPEGRFQSVTYSEAL